MERNVFKVKLADVVICVSTLHEMTEQMCREYLTEEEASFSITVYARDIAYEREKSAVWDMRHGKPVRYFSDDYLETLAVYRKIADRLLNFDTLLFHGSAVAVDGLCYLFAAESGIGKSTHVRLWQEMFGERARIVNDDKPLLKITDEGVTVYGTPWDGKHRLSCNTAVPLKAVCMLERGRENQIEKITPEEAWPLLLQQSRRPMEKGALKQAMRLVDMLSGTVGLYRLRCNMDSSAAKISYDGMQSI